MPIARRVIEAHVVDGKIYVIGENLNEVYDPTTDTWTTKTPMPDVATHFVSAMFDGKIYVVATNIYTLDAESERW
jgi:hypothetical protein